MRDAARDVHGTTVHGVDVDQATRCAHYDSDRDVVAIRFACCDRYYACIACHEAVADHAPAVWPVDQFDTPAVLCGVCGTKHAIATYLDSVDACPTCDAPFNPRCRHHHDHYFDVTN